MAGRSVHYNTEEKAQVMALMKQGNTMYRIHRETGIARDTLRKWRNEALADEDWEEPNKALITRTTEIIDDALDQIVEEGDPKKYLFQLNAIRGTSIDKKQRQNVTPDAAMAVRIQRPDGEIIEIGVKQ